jgi:ubiquitin-protein ligase E3 C
VFPFYWSIVYLHTSRSEYTDASQPKIEKDGSLLASYALILLRTFPTLGEEIRMWLYQGSVSIPKSNLKLPAIKLFWKAMSTTTTFAGICNDTRSALNILRGRSSRRSATANEPIKDDDWKAILLFLELYAFILRFTDDEEFLSGGEQSITDPTRPLSRSQENALPLVEVKRLTVFLKNLSFTMYFHAGELAGSGSSEAAHTGLSTYFGAGPQSKTFTFETSSSSQNENSKSNKFNEGFLGIAGMTFDYVRGIATRVMRMLYERDSRRRFLPKDHWLMTSKFDMEGFIPAVVAEEERRHQAAEVGEEQHDDDEEELVRRSDMRFGNRLAQMESLRKQQQRMARKNALAAIGPRLEVLQNMPYVIPFKTRVQIFRQFVYQDQLRRRNGAVDPDMWRMSVVQSFQGQGNPAEIRGVLAKHHAKIRRDNIFEDAFDQFYTLGEGLKEPIQITFVDQFDTVEAGIDGGGVTKEFLTSVTSEAFRPSSGGPNLFITNDQNLLYPNPAALDERKDLLRQAGIRQSDPEWSSQLGDLLRHYEFLGRVVGKCLYEGILVDIGFAGFFLLKWASSESTTSTSESRYQANINDLRDLDESLYQGLLQLKNHPGNVEDFSLDFTINDIISSPGEPIRTITRELLPNGSNIPVTNENRVLYVSGVARHRLHLQPFLQTRAFLRGLGQIINPSWLSMFNQAEIQTLIGGTVAEIDVEDLRRNTIYSGVYMIGDDGLEHPTIKLFWQVMKELDDQDRRKVLKYVTSTPRAPLLGFAQLNPRFSIRDAGSDEQRLPSASTCINLLKLPRYTSASTLRQKLVYAVNAGAGFDLS